MQCHLKEFTQPHRSCSSQCHTSNSGFNVTLIVKSLVFLLQTRGRFFESKYKSPSVTILFRGQRQQRPVVGKTCAALSFSNLKERGFRMPKDFPARTFLRNCWFYFQGDPCTSGEITFCPPFLQVCSWQWALWKKWSTMMTSSLLPASLIEAMP